MEGVVSETAQLRKKCTLAAETGGLFWGRDPAVMGDLFPPLKLVDTGPRQEQPTQWQWFMGSFLRKPLSILTPPSWLPSGNQTWLAGKWTICR